MKKKLGTFMMSLFLLTACESIDERSISNIELNGKGYHLLFFSNESSVDMEQNYYDVLLDLRKEFPKEMANLYLVQASKKNNVKKFNVSTYPTLVVVKNGKQVTRIEGKKSKKEILNNLTKVMK